MLVVGALVGTVLALAFVRAGSTDLQPEPSHGLKTETKIRKAIFVLRAVLVLFLI